MPQPSIARLGHVGIHAFDIEKERAFYADVLGLQVTDEAVYWPTGLKARQPYLEMVNLDDNPDEILRKIKQSVAEHGEEGVVEPRALEMQDIHA
ncbi:MAG: VOC family protein [Chloroflexota bacterium]|nr:VOC family protein [Chloroflexota bacterium]